MTDIRLLTAARYTLGEGIRWDAQQDKLWWVDIAQSLLCCHHLPSGQAQHWTLPQRVCCFAMTNTPGVFILGLAKSLARFDSTNGALTLLAEVEADNPATRINDGCTDSAGHFVFGTMHEYGPEPLGRIYRFTSQGQLQRMALPPVTVANSIAFSPDGQTMYYCDTPSARILMCNYNAHSGAVDGLRTFAELGHNSPPGYPDGSTVDAAGCVWNAEWGGQRITRYAPDGGMLEHISLPVSQPTCLTIGGQAMDTLFITSALIGLSNQQRSREPQAGAVFQLSLPGLRGLPAVLYPAANSTGA